MEDVAEDDPKSGDETSRATDVLVNMGRSISEKRKSSSQDFSSPAKRQKQDLGTSRLEHPAERTKRNIEFSSKEDESSSSSDEEMTRKQFVEKRGGNVARSDWRNGGFSESNMRTKFADIQKQYKEKQKELSNLAKGEFRSLDRTWGKSDSFR